MTGQDLIIAAYGMGTNSTALIAEMVRRGERIDAILAADAGGERPWTYAYRDLFSEWLVERGYPAIITVRKGGRQETLEEDCLRKAMLPSLSYGFKGCSHKYKIEPQNKWVNNWPPARQAWAAGRKVVKLIGYDVDEPHRAAIPEDEKYLYRYPLLEWGWGREECIAAITAAGLPQPGKSSCFFCPSMTKPEILQLRAEHPELLTRALAIEATAKDAGNLKSINGLGRKLNWGEFIELVDEAEANDPSAFFLRQHDFPNPPPCACYDGAPAEPGDLEDAA
ncbi:MULTISPECIES: phosphoadenosine phosphosulfate reductase [unclassified Pseudomonas]|uniref:phosphoadenosine phosphosulfate reductase n=1 Tax=unclassified Pseudomonas TaxID=196821 RepID=UPI002447EAB7|nr:MULTISPECIES: phosphoadenosine phosphosulfate reductase [unclassified Pseudomonas]MDH0894263.1 phosphoadenosine phosphosulfate reductase [Pseudomonas sp. GD03875]MDH1063442.1 phosphoadenosine phosphosulfate reductase [Pseudomonas sp. GD03985]